MIAFTRKAVITIILISLALGFAGGLLFTRSDNFDGIQTLIKLDEGKPKEVDFSLFWEVWAALQSKYVDKNDLDMKALVNGAIKGMVEAAGDPYTVFFEPATSKKFQEEISGAFSGVGMEIGKRNDILTVIAPIKDSPAFRAGVQAGDKVLRIDSKPTTDLSVEEAVNLIRGKKGTKVVLTIGKNGGETKDIEIIRDTIKIPAVEWEIVGDNIAYMQIFAFNQNVDSEFKKAAEEILKSNADKLIIDLRNNPGGLLDSAINLAGWFLDKNQIVVIEDFGNNIKNNFTSSGNGSLKPFQTVILINGGSASASEILAGALHDLREIKLIGEKTFGKGSVQELERFEDGSSLKVTVAKWLTPKGVSISEKGIEPDIEVKLPEQPDESLEFGTPGKDPQLDKAIEILK